MNGLFGLLAFLAFLFVLSGEPIKEPEVILQIDQPPRVVYVTPPDLPERNPER